MAVTRFTTTGVLVAAPLAVDRVVHPAGVHARGVVRVAVHRCKYLAGDRRVRLDDDVPPAGGTRRGARSGRTRRRSPKWLSRRPPQPMKRPPGPVRHRKQCAGRSCGGEAAHDHLFHGGFPFRGLAARIPVDRSRTPWSPAALTPNGVPTRGFSDLLSNCDRNDRKYTEIMSMLRKVFPYDSAHTADQPSMAARSRAKPGCPARPPVCRTWPSGCWQTEAHQRRRGRR